MTSAEELKKVTKIELRSVLLSMPTGASYRQLRNEFRDRVGHEIPYRECGYRSLDKFFEDIPDVVRIDYGANEDTRLFGVSDVKTAHIESLVSRQRITKRKVQPSRRYSNVLHSHSHARRMPSSFAIRGRTFGSSRYQQLVKQHNQLSDFSDSCTTSYEQDKKTGFKTERLASGSVDNPQFQPVRSDSDRPACGGGPARTYSNALSCQIGGGMGQGQQDSGGGLAQSVMEANTDIRHKVQEFLSLHPSGILLKDFARAFEKKCGVSIADLWTGFGSVYALLSSMTDIVKLIAQPGGDILVKLAKSSLLADIDKHQPKAATGVTPLPEFVATLTSLLSKFSSGIPCRDLPNEFLKFTGRSLSWSELGYHRIEDFVHNLPREFNIGYVGNEPIICLSRPDAGVKTSVSNTSAFVPAAVNNAPKTTPADVGSNITPAVRSLQVTAPAATTKSQDYTYVPSDTCSNELPMDAIGPGATIPKLKLPPVSDEFIRIRVSNVINPGLFDIQLIGKDTSDALEELMTTMQSTYNHPSGNAYAMPKSLRHIGQLCAARYEGNNEWHRCFITGFKGDQRLKVCFFDYGTVDCTSSPLRLLRSRYTQLPIQAVRARLANIQPVNRQWSNEACRSFMELVDNRCLFAIVTNVSQDTLSLMLTDTTGETDAHINNVLIDKGYAVYIPDVYSDFPDVPGPEPVRSATAPLSGYMDQPGSSGVRLTDNYGFHIVRIDRKAYVVCTEVSFLLWDHDLIRSKLHERGCKNLPKLILLPEDHPNVYELLIQFDIPGVMKNGKPAPILVLFELQSVVDILEMFQHPSEQLKVAVQRQVDLFDPDDVFWTSSDKRGAANLQSRENEHQRYRMLRKKRKALIDRLKHARSRDASATIVEEMMQIESEMYRLEPIIQDARCYDSSDSSSDVEGNNPSAATSFNRTVGAVTGQPSWNQKSKTTLPATAQKHADVTVTTANSEFIKTATSTTSVVRSMPNVRNSTASTAPSSSLSNWLRDATSANQNLGLVTPVIRTTPLSSAGATTNLSAATPLPTYHGLLAAQLSNLLLNPPTSSSAATTGPYGLNPGHLNLLGSETLLSAVAQQSLLNSLGHRNLQLPAASGSLVPVGGTSSSAKPLNAGSLFPLYGLLGTSFQSPTGSTATSSTGPVVPVLPPGLSMLGMLSAAGQLGAGGLGGLPGSSLLGYDYLSQLSQASQRQ